MNHFKSELFFSVFLHFLHSSLLNCLPKQLALWNLLKLKLNLNQFKQLNSGGWSNFRMSVFKWTPSFRWKIFTGDEFLRTPSSILDALMQFQNLKLQNSALKAEETFSALKLSGQSIWKREANCSNWMFKKHSIKQNRVRLSARPSWDHPSWKAKLIVCWKLESDLQWGSMRFFHKLHKLRKPRRIVEDAWWVAWRLTWLTWDGPGGFLSERLRAGRLNSSFASHVF